MPILVKFTIPLVLGNLFQLTYNAVDSIIVGHFVGKGALAAVGICNPITTLMILFLNGLCMGASILMGTQYGAKEHDIALRCGVFTDADDPVRALCRPDPDDASGGSLYFCYDKGISAHYFSWNDVYLSL